MNLNLSLASKTFLIGEYVALSEGPSLVAATQPTFQLRAHSDGRGEALGIHPQSPAGLWIRRHPEFYRQWSMAFIDPHNGAGGLGASTAQFALVHRLLSMRGHDAKTLRDDYLSCAWTGKGLSPSGADLLAQVTGGLVEIRGSEVFSHQWNFSGKGFAIVRTGQKLATHEHLRTLELGDLSSLRDLSKAAIQGLTAGNWMSFCTCINSFQVELDSRKLVVPHSQSMIEVMADWTGIEAVKSCGALGADTLAVFYDKEFETSFRERLAIRSWEVVATDLDLAPGLSVEVLTGDLHV